MHLNQFKINANFLARFYYVLILTLSILIEYLELGHSKSGSLKYWINGTKHIIIQLPY